MAPKVVFLMADYGHDPTETIVPYQVFKDAGFDITFATQSGTAPACDEKMLRGWTQKLLGAAAADVKAYDTHITDEAFVKPVSWSSETFSLDPYDLVFLPGGHDKGIRPLLESDKVHKMLADYFPKTQKPSKKVVGAICHGVMNLSETILPDGKAVIHDATTTALPGFFESFIYYTTMPFLGDYYKTFGAGSDNVQTSVTKRLDKPELYQNSLSGSPFIVKDEKYNYISGRFPPDARKLGEALVELVNSLEQK